MDISNLSQSRLTKLYSDAKVSANNVANTDLQTAATTRTDSPEFVEIQSQFGIQKDRLVTWGWQWSDETIANPTIDESIARAGLTENVDSIMKTIAGILEEVERMSNPKSAAKSSLLRMSTRSMPAKQVDPPPRELTAVDMKRCETLCNDLTSCIDVLYELSRSRRAIHEGTYPGASLGGAALSAPEKPTLPPPISKAVFSNRSYSSSGETLVTPTRVSTEKTLAIHDLPPKLDRKDLMLPQEPPPAYGSQGTNAIRMIGHLRSAAHTASTQQDMQPAMIEYVPFDPTYRETGVRLPPTEKLDALLNYFAKCNALQESALSGLLYCAGWFEDLDFSRYGIVYELPKSVSASTEGTRPRDLRPSSLLSILQTASKSGSNVSTVRPATNTIPALEDRFRLAQNVVRAFSRFQDEGLLHRDVNSNNVLFFTKSPKSSSPAPDASVADLFELASPHVCGFDLFSEYTITTDAENTPINIYQHPEAATRNRTYCAEFDAYSLGLILLEIGLWLPLSDLHKKKYSLSDFKRRIDSIWCKKLASKCGTLYMQVVQDFLGAASRRRAAGGNNTEAKTSLGQIYSRALNRLRRLCLIDDSEPFDTPSDSMQNSTLEAMVQQGLALDQTQAINQWTEKTQMFAEPSSTIDATQIPTLSVDAGSGPVGTRLDGSSHRGSFAERHQPHTLPVSIEEDNEDALSRRGSNASNTRGSPSPRWNFGFGSPRSKDMASETGSQLSVMPVYKDAARTILRAWRSRRDTPSFQEYKRKVTLIQKAWRRRNSRKNSNSTSSETDSSGFYTSTEQLSTQQYSANDATILQTNPQTQPRKKLRIQPVKLPAARLEEWHTDLLPRLERVLSRALKDSPETVSIDLLCVGDTLAKARPTIFVTCSSTARVKAVLSRRFPYNREIYDLKVRRGSVRRSKSRPSTKRSRQIHRSMANKKEDGPLNPDYQKRPLCGASIGAYVDGKHLPPVSYGGVITMDVGNGPELYGMTVHHLLDPQSDGEDGNESDEGESGYFDEDDEEQASPGATRSSAAGGSSWLAGMGTEPGLALNEMGAHSGYLEISDDSSINSDAEAPELDYSSDEEDEGSVVDSHASTEGDMHGVSPNGAVDDPVYVTQPAIDDVDDEFFPCESDRDEDHLASHRLGQVYASSGIRRWRRNGMVHEIDWALLKLDDDRLQPVNVVQGGRKYLRGVRQGSPLLGSGVSHKPEDSGVDTSGPNPLLEAASANRKTLLPTLLQPVSRSPEFSASDDEYPTSIVPADKLGSLRVHCFGRTSGLKEGVIGDTMSSVRIYRRRSFSRSWHVLGGFGIGGDSGAWILDNETGRVCGHVLAFAERNSLAYICPLEIMFEDILRVLDAKSISLPGGEEAVVRSDVISRRGTFETNASAGAERYSGDDSDELHFRMNGLGIEDVDPDDRSGGIVFRSSPVRTARRGVSRSSEHDRDRLMYASGGLLSMSAGESFTASVERELVV